MFYRHALVAFLIVVGNVGFLSAKSIGSTSDVVALTGLSVVDVNTGRITHAQTMLIENGIISYLGVPLGAEQMTGVITHDHARQYAIPGLWDMHVHFRGGPDLAEENRLWLRCRRTATSGDSGGRHRKMATAPDKQSAVRTAKVPA